MARRLLLRVGSKETEMRALPLVLVAVAVAACSSNPSSDSGSPFASVTQPLETVSSFGANPGNLNMYRYVPASMPKNAPLVVALHGCTQKATDYEATGWSALAEKQKFYVVYAEQTTSNNPVSCFDWYGKYNTPSDKTNLTRGKGEPESIKEMVDKMKADFSIDPARVFVVGFSAGAAEAAVVLADWPDVFSAGAIESGIPFDCPSTSNGDVFNCMSPGKDLTPSQWGDFVRSAYSAWKGPWPRVSIWQGSKDTTVAPMNEQELVDQWTNVQGIGTTPSATETVDGQKRARYLGKDGSVAVEAWTIDGMQHGVAIDPSHGCGTAGAYAIDEKICSTTHIAEFFGIMSGATPPPPSDAGAPDTAPADTGVADSGSDSGSPSSSGAVHETVSTGGGPDLPWSLGGWDLSTDDHTAVAGSRSLHAKVVNAFGNSAKTAAVTVHVPSGAHLRYARKLSLKGANIGTTVRFAVEIVDGGATTVVDEKKFGLGSYAESAWTARDGLDLSAFAGHDVTLRLVASTNDPWSFASVAEATIDDLAIE